MNHAGGVYAGISKLGRGLCGQTVYKHRKKVIKKVTEMVINVTLFVTFFKLLIYNNQLSPFTIFQCPPLAAPSRCISPNFFNRSRLYLMPSSVELSIYKANSLRDAIYCQVSQNVFLHLEKFLGSF